MKTDPTPTIAGASGMPLSYEAIEAGRAKMSRGKGTTKPSTAISDSLETTDRDPEGPLRWQAAAKPKPDPQSKRDAGQTGERLDLMG